MALLIGLIFGSGAELRAEERTAKIKALWVNPSLDKDSEKASGAMNVEVRVRENTLVDDDGRLVAQVACSTPTPGMRSEQWQSSAWIAAFVASREKGVSLADYEFNLRVPEPIDGPSASMAVGVTMLALMNKDVVKEDWAITGTIGPDGTIGPVGGVDKKLIAAARKGIQRFGFPAGQRMVYNNEERDFVDLVVLGKKLGLEEVVELNGIEDAYLFTTGKALVTKWSGIEVDSTLLVPPQLTNSTISRLSASIRDFSQSFESGYSDGKRSIDDRIPTSYNRRPFADFTLQEAKKYNERMKLARVGGALTQAYFNGIRAKASLEIGDIYSQLTAPSAKSGKVMVNEVLKGILTSYSKVHEEVESARRSLNDTISDASTGGTFFTRIEGLNASISMREGVAYQSSAEEMFISAFIQIMLAMNESTTKKSSVVILNDNFFDSLRKTAEYFAMSLTRYRTARDWYSFSMLHRATVDVDVDLRDEFYQTVGKYYHKGAEAALAYVDSTLVSKWEDDFKKEHAEGRSAYLLDFGRFPHQRAFVEASYLPMSYATSSASRRDPTEEANLRVWLKKEGLGSETIVARRDDAVQDYGSGVTALIGLSALIFKHYNYQNTPDLMRNSRSFGIFLDQARDRTIRRSAQLRVKLAGVAGKSPKEALLPAAIGLNIELADTLRYGDSDDMISSFLVYWRATMLCDLGLMMLEHAGK